MRPWQRWLAIGSGTLASLWSRAGALAQHEEKGIVPALRAVILDVTSRMDAKLGTWVEGNSLTDPEGQDFINDLAGFIGRVVAFIAEALGDLLVELDFM